MAPTEPGTVYCIQIPLRRSFYKFFENITKILTNSARTSYHIERQSVKNNEIMTLIYSYVQCVRSTNAQFELLNSLASFLTLLPFVLSLTSEPRCRVLLSCPCCLGLEALSLCLLDWPLLPCPGYFVLVVLPL